MAEHYPLTHAEHSLPSESHSDVRWPPLRRPSSDVLRLIGAFKVSTVTNYTKVYTPNEMLIARFTHSQRQGHYIIP